MLLAMKWHTVARAQMPLLLQSHELWPRIRINLVAYFRVLWRYLLRVRMVIEIVRIVRMGSNAAAFSFVPVSILAMRMVPLVVVVLLEMLIVNGVVVVVVAMIAVVRSFVVMVVAVVVVVVATPMVSAVATVVVVGVLIFVVLVVVHAIHIVVVVRCAAALVGLTLGALGLVGLCSCGAAALASHGNGAVFLANATPSVR